MKALRRFLSRLAGSMSRRHNDERLREELDAHVVMQTAEYVRAGLSPEEARRQALLKFGPTEAVRASCRDVQSLPALDDVVQDMRYTLRQLRKAPVFTLTATMSLGLGIGASAAVFTVIERVLLRALPVSNPHELVYITDERILTQASPRFSYPFYTLVRDANVLDGVAARAAVSLSAGVNGQILRVSGELVSGSNFSVIGAGTQLGRALSAEDDRTPGAHPVAVISERLWRRTFGPDASVIGRSVQLNDHVFTIVGVAARDFSGTDVGLPTEIWLPIMMQREVGRDLLTEARTNWLEIVGRLAPGMTRERAAEQLTTHLQRRAPELSSSHGSARRLVLTPGANGNSPLRRELGPALGVLMALTGLAMGLACINVASLVSVRSARREKEIAIRSALGARRSRLTRQLLTEGLVLATLGGTAGLLVAPWVARLLVASQSRLVAIDASLDARVLGFGILVSVLTGLIVAQAPIFASRGSGLPQLSEHSVRPSMISRRLSAHDLIVTLQIAMALAMLINAALLVQSIRSFNSVDPGFRADNLVLATLDPKAAGYGSDRVDGFWRNTLERVRQIPAVQSVSLARTVPLAPGRQRQPWLHPTSGETLELDTNFVGPQYFRTLAVPLVRGREFADEDGRTSRAVVIVNERLARMFWPDQDPIGKGIRLPASGNPPAEVIGVVRDVKYRDLRGDTDPMFYRPVLQTRSTDPMTLHVRASSDPREVVSAIRLAVQNVDPNVPLFEVTTLQEQLDTSFAQTRQAALLTGVFGTLALLLSGIGVYGVTALAVTRRTRDIGIRMALGARSRDIVRAIGSRAITLAAAGLGLGLVGSLAFTQVTGTLLFGVTAADSATFVAMAALLAFTALLAFAIPARAATRLDALAAIRRE